MKTLYCYHCHTETPLVSAHYRCRNYTCRNHTLTVSYSSLLDDARNELRKIFSNRKSRKTLWSAPLVNQLVSCPHQRWYPGSSLDAICLYCFRCLLDDCRHFYDPECPVCGTTLNESLRFSDANNIIPVYGGPFSGKTLLLKDLAITAEQHAHRRKETFFVHGREGREFVQRQVTRQSLPAPTVGISPPILFCTSAKTYRVLFEMPGRLDLEDNESGRIDFQMLAKPRQIILTVDPYSFLMKVSRFLPSIPPYMSKAIRRCPADVVLSSLLDTCEAYGLANSNGKIPVQMDIVLTKADVIEKLALFHTDPSFKRMSGELFEAFTITPDGDTSESLLVDGLIEAWLNSDTVGQYELTLKARRFETVIYHMVSSLGFNRLLFDTKTQRTYTLKNPEPLGMEPLLDSIFEKHDSANHHDFAFS